MKLRRTKAVEKELDFIVTVRNVIFKKVMFWGIAKKSRNIFEKRFLVFFNGGNYKHS